MIDRPTPPSSHPDRYCGPACRRAAHLAGRIRRTIPETCATCGRSFETEHREQAYRSLGPGPADVGGATVAADLPNAAGGAPGSEIAGTAQAAAVERSLSTAPGLFGPA